MFKIGIIGIGNMGEAILNGILKNTNIKPEQIIVSDVNSERVNFIVNKYSVAGTDNNQRLVKLSEIIFIVVKPKDFEKLASSIKQHIAKKILISVMAGVRIKTIKDILSDGYIVRIMPNTAALVGESATAVAFEETFPEDKKKEVLNLINSFGKVFVIDEVLMDAFTGLAGSGPAYVFNILDAFAQAGVKQGFSYQQALDIALQTFYGSVKLLIETKEHPAVLRDKVTSPAGTTIYGLHEFEKGAFRDVIINAIESATKRSKELSK